MPHELAQLWLLENPAGFFFLLSILERIANHNKQADRLPWTFYKKESDSFKLYIYNKYEMRTDVQYDTARCSIFC